MRLDVFKYVVAGFCAVCVLMIILMMCGCTMYRINMDHPEGTEFDNTDKRVESGKK